MNKINGKALLEPLCFRDPPTCLEHWEKLFEEGLGWNLQQSVLGLCSSAAVQIAVLRWLCVIPGQLGAQWGTLKLLNSQSPDIYCVPCVYFFLTSGTWLDIKQGVTRVKERILDQECSKMIPTPLLVPELFIPMDSLEDVVATSVPFWFQNPPPHGQMKVHWNRIWVTVKGWASDRKAAALPLPWALLEECPFRLELPSTSGRMLMQHLFPYICWWLKLWGGVFFLWTAK